MDEVPLLLWDNMPGILGLAFGMFGLGLFVGIVAGFWWGRARTSGDDNGWRKLCETINDQQAEIERLRGELRHGLSID